MSSLTPYQIKYLRHFLVQKYVRYEDVQLELIDHLATAIEEKQQEEPEMTFELALDFVYKGFGVGGFAKIVKEKEKSLGKYWRKHVWSCFLEFLKPPLIFVGIALFCVFYFLQTASGVFLLTGFAYASIIGVVIMISICYKMNVKEDDLNKYLFLKSYWGLVGISLYFSLYLFPSTFTSFPDGIFYIKNFPYALTISSLYFTINIILIYILIFKIPQGLVATMKKQHQNYTLA